MDWNDQITRSNFVLELLLIAETSDVDSMMDKLLEVLIENGEEIFAASTTPKNEMDRALNQIIEWFANNERYEACHEIKKIKEKCLK